MKRRGAESVRKKLEGLTPKQEIEYWRKRSEEFQAEQSRIQAPEKRYRPKNAPKNALKNTSQNQAGM
ncbi:hypothetical protein D3C83_293610 [compost metagenome]